MNFDRKKFYDSFRIELGPLAQSQVNGLNFLLESMETDPDLIDYRHAAYMLATTYHETAKTFQPIEEYGRGKGHSYGLMNSETGQTYYGRGYVQLTHIGNYRAMGQVLDLPFVERPNLALVPEHAYKIMSYGMRKGFFTGKCLKDYIDGPCDFLHARKIINGMDKADLIAGYADKFANILEEAMI